MSYYQPPGPGEYTARIAAQISELLSRPADMSGRAVALRMFATLRRENRKPFSVQREFMLSNGINPDTGAELAAARTPEPAIARIPGEDDE